MPLAPDQIKATRMEVVAPSFFLTPFKKMTIEVGEVTNRVYFIKDGKVIAVALRKEKA